MIVKLLTVHHLEFLSLKGGRRGLSESTFVKLSEISIHGSNFFHRENSSICVVCCIFSFKLQAISLDADQTASISRMRRVHPFFCKFDF